MTSSLFDLDLSKLNIPADDKTTRKLMMLIEGTYGIGVKASIAKYGYSEQRYYQLLKAFKKEGVQALVDQKRGPKTNRVRSEKVIGQIIRLRFLDPDAGAEVIAQKLRQMGMTVSVRSVERTITQYGLQKKTPSVQSR
jgi:transposase